MDVGSTGQGKAGTGTKAAQRSRLVAFRMPVLLWLASAASMLAVVIVSGDNIRDSGVRRAVAAALDAVSPLYAVWRLGSDAVHGFKAAGTGAKVGRVLALVLMGAVVAMHVYTVWMLGTKNIKPQVNYNRLFTKFGAALGLASTLGLLTWEGAARVARRWVRAVLYVVLSVLVVVCLLGYIIALVGVATNVFSAKTEMRPA
jgi:hypothetical protein